MIICGTGHRPSYCPCGYDDKHSWLLDLKKRTAEQLKKGEVKEVIAGGAIGFDTWLAEVAIEQKIPLTLILPFKGQELAWPRVSQLRYHEIIEAAARVTFLHSSYCREAFHDRDRAMVDAAETVYALWNPEVKNGGTYYTVQYTLKNKKPLVNLWKGVVHDQAR